jgi:hypothetical protein
MLAIAALDEGPRPTVHDHVHDCRRAVANDRHLGARSLGRDVGKVSEGLSSPGPLLNF